MESPPVESRVSFGRDDRFVVRLLLTLGLVLLVGASVALVVVAAHVFLLTFAGILLAVFLRGLAQSVSRRTGLGPGWSLGLVVAGLTILFTLAGWLLAATFAGQFSALAESLEKAARGLHEQLRNWPWARRMIESTRTNGSDSAQIEYLERLAGWFSTTLGGAGDLVVIGFVGLYIAIEPTLYRRGLVRLFPRRHRPRAVSLLDELGDQLQRWLIGRVINMAIIGVATAIGLWLLGIPLVLALALIAFVLDFIPYIGPLLSTIPAVVVALSISPNAALSVVVLYIVVQTVESYLLTPLIQKQAVELPPAVTLLTQLLLGGLTGVLGLALAPPLTAVATTLVERLYVEDVLGDYPADDATAPDRPVPSGPGS